MTRVSRNILYKKYEDRVKELMVETLVDLKNKKDTIEFFEEFFTWTEKIMFSKRLAIGVLLKKGWGFHEICKILKVSSGTVSNVNYWIGHNSGGFGKQVDNILKKEDSETKWKDFWFDIGKAFSKKSVNWISPIDYDRIAKEKHKQLI